MASKQPIIRQLKCSGIVTKLWVYLDKRKDVSSEIEKAVPISGYKVKKIVNRNRKGWYHWF